MAGIKGRLEQGGVEGAGGGPFYDLEDVKVRLDLSDVEDAEALVGKEILVEGRFEVEVRGEEEALIFKARELKEAQKA